MLDTGNHSVDLNGSTFYVDCTLPNRLVTFKSALKVCFKMRGELINSLLSINDLVYALWAYKAINLFFKHSYHSYHIELWIKN